MKNHNDNPLKYNVVFIVSESPIDTSHLERDAHVRHLINEELELEGIETTTRSGWRITKRAPNHCLLNDQHEFTGVGDFQAETILSWLKSLVASVIYFPKYRKNSENL